MFSGPIIPASDLPHPMLRLRTESVLASMPLPPRYTLCSDGRHVLRSSTLYRLILAPWRLSTPSFGYLFSSWPVCPQLVLPKRNFGDPLVRSFCVHGAVFPIFTTFVLLQKGKSSACYLHSTQGSYCSQGCLHQHSSNRFFTKKISCPPQTCSTFKNHPKSSRS